VTLGTSVLGFAVVAAAPATVRAIDGVTGATLIGFGARLALSAR
jgi:hypothetical protein